MYMCIYLTAANIATAAMYIKHFFVDTFNRDTKYLPLSMNAC